MSYGALDAYNAGSLNEDGSEPTSKLKGIKNTVRTYLGAATANKDGTQPESRIGKAKNFVKSPLGLVTIGAGISLAYVGLAATIGSKTSGNDLGNRYAGREYSPWYFPLNPDKTDTGLYGIGRKVIIGAAENTDLGSHATNVATNLVHNVPIYALPTIAGVVGDSVKHVAKKRRKN